MSSALGYVYSFALHFGSSFHVTSEPRTIANPFDAAERRHPDDQGQLKINLLENWSTSLQTAIVRWLEVYRDEPQPSSIIAIDPHEILSIDEFAEGILDRISQLGKVSRCGLIRFAQRGWNSELLLDQGEWATFIHFNGVPVA
jgi:hypothetical protein